PTATTTYTVTGTSNGCQSSDSVEVTVLSDNVNANAGEDVTICEGDSVTLTASGGLTYQWSTGETTQSITVSPSATTTYTVTAYSPSGNNSDTDDVTVIVNPLPNASAGDDVSICLGSSVTLTASGGTSYLWSTGATTQSITVSPTATTTYSVEVTQNGCSGSDEVTVTVNNPPTVNAGNDVTIFEGESTILTATGADSYQWSTGETTQSITVSPTATTTYTVTGTSNGCQSTDSVVVTVLPETVVADAGENRGVCRGFSVTLTAHGGDTYLWSTGETTQSITVSPIVTTTYSVTAFVGNSQDTDEVTVFVTPIPVVDIINGDNVTILEGEFVTLSAIGADTYEWNNGATQPNILVSPRASTTYSVIGYVNDCASDQKSVTVNVVPQVTAFAGENQTICRSQSVILTASGGDQYLWSTGDTTQTITVTPDETTEYSVTVYNELDYDTADVTVFVNDCSVPDDIINTQPFDFVVFPNPTSGDLKIKISGLLRASSLTMYDLAGKVLYHEVIEEEDRVGFRRLIDMSKFSNGLYLLKLTNDNNVYTKKVILDR
ncbi:MAG TPA: T9SS type A sorting domain-containing protein, partial [Aquaticitalea sp.]|nr:T9SS type A sorting domain-containing protein [Aquaticitalea sp.]